VYSEEEYLLLSGIQHFCFCKRQWALGYIEQLWEENVLTLEGRLIHERVHESTSAETRRDKIISRGMAVSSAKLGCSGACDVVELHYDDEGVTIFGREGRFRPVPIEYKRGSPKENDADRLQLCAQAMCLEEMLLCEIQAGYLFYNEIRRREKVDFDLTLRDKVYRLFEEMHDYVKRQYTPKVKSSKSCKACSIVNLCVPKLNKGKPVQGYIDEMLGE